MTTIAQELKLRDKVWFKPSCDSYDCVTNTTYFKADKLYLCELMAKPDLFKTKDESNDNALIRAFTYCAYLMTNGEWIIPDLNELIQKQKELGAFFTVWFIKKDGTERKMTCRFGVKKHLKGGKTVLDENKFWIVWDSTARDYRAVNKESVFRVKAGGIVYEKEST